MFNAKWVKPECRKRLVKRRHASPSATSAGTSAPSARTSCGCSKSPLTNGAPTVGPAAATSTYTAAQAAIRPKVMGRREKAKRLRELAALYLADGVADLDLGYVLQRAAEHALKVRTVALSGGPEALDLDVSPVSGAPASPRSGAELSKSIPVRTACERPRLLALSPLHSIFET